MSQFQEVTNGPVSPGATPNPSAGAVASVAGRTGAVTLAKTDVGLPLVDNTPDTGKPVSTAQQTADAAVASAAAAALTTHSSNTSNPHSTTKAQVGLSNVPNTDATARSSHTGTQLASTISDFDAAVVAAAPAGTSVREPAVTQAAHGFSVKQAVYRLSDGTWALARANAMGTSRGVHVIESVTTNTFVPVQGGKLTTTGLTVGQYYLSAATAGLLTQTAPTGAAEFVVPVMFAATTTIAVVAVSEPLSLALIPNAALDTDAARPAQVSGGERTAGSETTLRSFAPADVAAMAALHGGGSGSNGHVMSGGIAATVFSFLETIAGGSASTDFAALPVVHGSNASVTF